MAADSDSHGFSAHETCMSLMQRKQRETNLKQEIQMSVDGGCLSSLWTNLASREPFALLASGTREEEMKSGDKMMLH